MPFLGSPVLLGLVLLVGGLAIAPTLIATMAVLQVRVPAARLTEALGWTSTGMAGGVALGAAALGQVIDAAGATGGLWAMVGVGVALALAGQAVRDPAGPVSAPTAPVSAPTAPVPAARPRTREAARSRPGE